MKKILNILLGVLMAITVVMMAYAIFTGGSEAAISANLVWAYVLMVLAICSVIFCAVYGMMKNPAGIKGTLLSLGLVVVVVLASYFVAAGRDILIPNFSDGGYFPHTATVIADCSILVAYIAMGAAIVVALYSEVAKLFK